MKLDEEMIIINGKIETPNIYSFSYNQKKDRCYIKYKNNKNKTWSYSIFNVLYLRNPIKLDSSDYNIKSNGIYLENIKDIYCFKDYDKRCYFHIVFENNIEKDYKENQLCISKKMLIDQKSKKLFEYIKEVAYNTSIVIDDKRILADSFKKIETLDETSALADYFNQRDILKKSKDTFIIFPFGCNSSQYDAVKNAIENKISIIEGPPGTGKTQTILNIIANLLIRNKTCQVVSNNNSAIENIEEKLEKYMLDFFVAKLGSNINKNSFIENQKNISDLSEYENYNLTTLKNEIKELEEEVQYTYNTERKLAETKQLLSEIKIEYEYYKKYLKDNNIETLEIRKISNNINKVIINIENKDKISLFDKIIYSFIERVGNIKLYKNNKELIVNSLKQAFYEYKISTTEKDINIMTDIIKIRKDKVERYIDLSMKLFKKYLSTRFNKRKIYELNDIKKDYVSFLNDYPVILSTTYSSRNSFNPEVNFDYVIMDESSQIDIATGSLALSSATNAVIIGDEKQLPNVLPEEEKKITDRIFGKYELNECFNFKNSMLTSIKSALPNAPICLLREHYRCHPKIIGFCDKKFYNGKLAIMTADNNERNVIKVIRSNEGNHSRDRMNDRELDIIKELIPKINSNDIGIITPYNAQVKRIREELKDVEVNTIHKYQGREKDVIIISTVDDKISDFVNDPHILNVAISRAKKQLYVIVTGNDISNTNINDLIDYCNYNNFELEESDIYSIFDYLYKQYTEDRIRYLNKHKKVSEYDSENLMYTIIEEEIKNKNSLGLIIHQQLKQLIKNKDKLTEDELKYVMNPLTHLDFLIYNKITKKPVLVIEVDGYEYHKDGTKQKERDIKKDSVLNKYNIPILRFSTTGSKEKEKLHIKLEELEENTK